MTAKAEWQLTGTSRVPARQLSLTPSGRGDPLECGNVASSRVSLRSSAEIPAPAGQVWDLICDWAGMLQWWLPAEKGGLQGAELTGCELIGAPGSVPRTRRMVLSDGTTVDETIVYQNDKSRRIHYMKADDQSISGYLASTYVDELENGNCIVYISSEFDVGGPAERASGAARFEAVYAAMFKGYIDYFTRSPAV
jgi:hypothetical protein